MKVWSWLITYVQSVKLPHRVQLRFSNFASASSTAPETGVGRMALSSYEFNLIKHGRTLATELMECDDDGDAMQKAKQLLSVSTFNSIEVWQGARKVGVAERRSW